MHKRFVSYALLIATTAAVLLVMVIQPREAALRKKKIDDNKRQFFLAQVCGPGSWGILGCPPEPLPPSGGGVSPSGGGTTNFFGISIDPKMREEIESKSLKNLMLSGYAETFLTKGLYPTIYDYTVSAALFAFTSTQGRYGHQDLPLMYERVSELVYQALTKTPAPKTGQSIENYIAEAAKYLKCLAETMRIFDQETSRLEEYLLNPDPKVVELAKKIDACLPIEEEKKIIQPVVAEPEKTAVAVVAETASEPKPTSALQRVVQAFIMQLRNKFINIRDTAIKLVPIKLSQQKQTENIKKIGDMIDFFGRAYDELCKKLNRLDC